MVIKVHGIPLSTCTARVLLCLCEKGLQYELVPVDVENSAHKKPPYLSLNVRLLSIGVDGSGWFSGVSPIQSSNQALIRQMIVNPIYGIAPDEKIIEIELQNLAKVLDVYEE
ncbi:hypothetical protein Gotur_019146, partial [Gossypium turneri]